MGIVYGKKKLTLRAKTPETPEAQPPKRNLPAARTETLPAPPMSHKVYAGSISTIAFLAIEAFETGGTVGTTGLGLGFITFLMTANEVTGTAVAVTTGAIALIRKIPEAKRSAQNVYHSTLARLNASPICPEP